MAEEVAARAGSAKQAEHALRRRVLEDSRLSRPARAQVASAVVGGRLFCGAGTWDALSVPQQRKINGAWCGAMRRVAGQSFGPRGPAEPGRTASVLASLWQPPASTRIAVARLRHVARVAADGGPLAALLRGGGGSSWRAALIQDLRWLHTTLSDRLAELPVPSEQTAAEWEKLWTDWPHQWLALVTAAAKANQLLLDPAGPPADGSPADSDAMTSAAVAVAESDEAAIADAEMHEVVCIDAGAAMAAGDALPAHECAQCGRRFATERAYKAHLSRVHGRVREVRRFVRTTSCPVCATEFHTFARVHQHLERGARTCREAFATGALRQSSETEQAVVDAALLAEGRKARRTGRQATCGPPSLPQRQA